MLRILLLMLSTPLFCGILSPSGGFCQTPKEDAPAKDAAETLEKTREVYRNLHGYHFERTTTILEAREGRKPEPTVKLKLTTATAGAERPPEGFLFSLPLNLVRFRLGMEIDGEQFLEVNGEGRSWWYSSREKIYKKREGQSVLGSVPATVLFGLHSFPVTVLEPGAIEDARIVREESIEVDKRQRSCYVIEGHAKSFDIAAFAEKHAAAADSGKPVELPPMPKFLGMETMLTMLYAQGYLGEGRQLSVYTPKGKETKVTLWIDKDAHLLVQSEMTSTIQKSTITKEKPDTPKEEEIVVTLKDAFTRLDVAEDLPRELFHFTPPPDAKELKDEPAKEEK